MYLPSLLFLDIELALFAALLASVFDSPKLNRLVVTNSDFSELNSKILSGLDWGFLASLEFTSLTGWLATSNLDIPMFLFHIPNLRHIHLHNCHIVDFFLEKFLATLGTYPTSPEPYSPAPELETLTVIGGRFGDRAVIHFLETRAAAAGLTKL